MQANDLIQQLRLLDLEEKEAKVYLAALETGVAPMAVLARYAGIKRPTAYYIIEELIKKGLIIKLPRGKRILYKAESPKKFNQLFQRQEQAFEKILPTLDAKFRSTFKLPKISFHEGRNALYSVYENIFGSGRTTYAMVDMAEFTNLFNDTDSQHFFKLLKQSGGYLYDLFQYSPQAAQIKKSPWRHGISRTKILPPAFKAAVDILVTNTKVALISLKNQIAVMIEDKDIAEAQKQLMVNLWRARR